MANSEPRGQTGVAIRAFCARCALPAFCNADGICWVCESGDIPAHREGDADDDIRALRQDLDAALERIAALERRIGGNNG